MRNTTPILPAIVALLLSGYSSADHLTDAASVLCDTIKACALEVVAGEDLTDDLRQKMNPILEQNCAAMRSRVQAVPVNHELYQPAVDCLRSMASLGCQQLYNAGEVKTPACTAYEQKVQATSALQP